MGKVEKLIPNLNDKKKYVLYYETLYESLGLKITKIHRGIKFEESSWLKMYIDLNTTLRAKAKNKFEKDLFKLMNNAVFGKTMENIRNRVDIELVGNKEKAKARKLAAKPNFRHCTIFDENLVAIHMKKIKLTFNKPVYLGMCILDLSKTLMYDFHYNYIKKKYGSKAKLLFTDTDSLCYVIETEAFLQGHFWGCGNAKFDTSKIFQRIIPSGIPVGLNKKVIGMFKDKCGGKVMQEFVGLRAKLYSYKMYKGQEQKRCKGVKQSVVRIEIHLCPVYLVGKNRCKR